MKKLVLLSTLAASLIGLSSFGQGYLILGSANKTIWDLANYKTGAGGPSTNSFALVWGSTSFTPTVDGIQAGVATNALSGVSAAGTQDGTYSVAAAWAAILGDTHFFVANDLATGPSVATGIAGQNGAISYNGGGGFQISGAPAGTYSMFFLAWNNRGGLDLTPTAAQAAGDFVGWSTVFTETLVATGNDLNLQTTPFTPFGVAGVVPEPTTLALAGLGGLSLLLMRRKQS